MKKGVIALILVLALVIIVSPGIIGKLAERQVDDNLNRAVSHGELVVTTEGFDGGWFSSEGEHRIELGKGTLRDAFGGLSDDGDEPPVLVITTRMDHGLIPVTSMARDKGSLAPGLGNAVSTMRVDYGDDESFELPGAIYSKVALNGDLESQYLVQGGAREEDGTVFSWQDAEIGVIADASTGLYDYEGDIGGFEVSDGGEGFSLGPLKFSGKQGRSEHGIWLGDFDLTLDSVDAKSDDPGAPKMQGLSVSGGNELKGDRAVGTSKLSIATISVPQFGDASVDIGASSDLDAQAFGALMRVLDSLPDDPDPGAALAAGQQPAKDLFAAGLEASIDRLDIALPMGTIESRLNFSVPKNDRDSFEWTQLLMTAAADLDLKVPAELVEMAVAMQPEFGGIVGLGYLRQEGDYYVMDAEMKNGLLTVNGAPIPIPLGMF